MRSGKLNINPARNPAILDTATWDREAAWAAIQAIEDAYWPALIEAATNGSSVPAAHGLTLYAPASVWHEGVFYCLAGLADGQQVFLEIGSGAEDSDLAVPIGTKSVPAIASNLRIYPTDAAIIDRFFRLFAPDKGPRALGPVPRLGIGTRMTTAVWPAIWQAMAQGGFAANAIQNSVRELKLSGDTARRPAGREKHRIRFRGHRDRLHRQLVRRAVGGGRARRTQARLAS